MPLTPEQQHAVDGWFPGAQLVDDLSWGLVDDTPAETDPEVHRQAGALLAVLHGQASRVDEEYEQRMDARALRWLDPPTPRGRGRPQ